VRDTAIPGVDAAAAALAVVVGCRGSSGGLTGSGDCPTVYPWNIPDVGSAPVDAGGQTLCVARQKVAAQVTCVAAGRPLHLDCPACSAG
jgi:hypothetical protein